jgi:hypothetical protein
MSELTRCNHCVLRDIEKFAKQDGRVVTLIPNSTIGSGKPALTGTVVLVHGADEVPDAERHWAAWLWTITETCVC